MANKDWLPTTREGTLSMAKDWKSVLDVRGDEWGIPQNVTQDFDGKIQTAETALATAKNETTRTPVTTAQCKAAFEELIAAMRSIKRKYFTELSDADLISLGLKPRDTTLTPSGKPTAQVTIETYLVGRHELGVKIVYLTGSPNDAANKGYRIWYSVLPAGETAPADPEELRKSFFTKRKKDVIEFEFGASGKNAVFAVQIENEGKKGPWGPLVTALIP